MSTSRVTVEISLEGPLKALFHGQLQIPTGLTNVIIKYGKTCIDYKSPTAYADRVPMS